MVEQGDKQQLTLTHYKLCPGIDDLLLLLLKLFIYRTVSPHQHKTNVREGTDGQSCTCTPIFRVATTPLAEPEMREITLLPSFDKQKGKVCNSNTDK